MKLIKCNGNYAIGFLLALLITSCSKDNLLPSDPSNSPISGRSDGLIEINYDLDYTIITKIDCDPSKLDLAASSPIADKQRINMTIFEDGDIKLITETIGSRNGFTVPHNTPASDLPLVVKTVLSGNQLNLYDGNNQLIRSVPDQSISMPFVAEQISETLSNLELTDQEFGSILACLRANVDFEVLMDLIQNPPSGVIVNNITNDVITLRMPVPQEMATPDAQYVVNIINIPDRLLMGTRLYNNNNQVMQCTMFKYDNCNLVAFKQEIHEHLPDCDNAVMQIFGEISNLDISIL